MHSTSVEASTAAELGLVWSICWAWVTKNSFQQDVYLILLFLPPGSPHRCAGLSVGKDSVKKRSKTPVMYSLYAPHVRAAMLSDLIHGGAWKVCSPQFGCPVRPLGLLH